MSYEQKNMLFKVLARLETVKGDMVEISETLKDNESAWSQRLIAGIDKTSIEQIMLDIMAVLT